MEKRPRYLNLEKDKELLQDLRERVMERVKELPGSRLLKVKVNLIFLPALYLGCYLLALYSADTAGWFLFFYALMGLLVVLIFCELIHELAHNNVFKEARHNALAFRMFDFLGANSYIWKRRHLRSHHRYPNVDGWDTDVEQKGPIAIFLDEDKRGYKGYQHVYIFFLYPFFMLNWLLLRDFKDFFDKSRIIQRSVSIPRVEFLRLFVFKALYLFMMVGVPWLFTSASLLLSLSGLLLLTVSGSILAMFVLLTPHANAGNEFLLPDEEGVFQTSWLGHQLAATNDIDSSSWFTRFFMGNFNYHVAHHLFPNVSAVYAPEVTEVIREFAAENGLPYKSYPIGVSLMKHYELIRRNARSMRAHFQEETI